MNKNISIYCLVLLMSLNLQAQIVIDSNNSSPDVSAMLDVKSIDKGFLMPRMTSAQRIAISNPAIGLLVYDQTTLGFWFYNGTVWQDLSLEYTYSEILDVDTDTKIQVEENADDDVIRFDVLGFESMVIDNTGMVGIGTDSPTDRLHINTLGGIRMSNSEISNTSDVTGILLYDENYSGTGEIGEGKFKGSAGGLGVKNEDGWGALISTANMAALKMNVNSLHIGGSSDPGDNNLMVDGLMQIKSTNLNNGLFLISQDSSGLVGWKSINLLTKFFSSEFQSSYNSTTNGDDWHDMTIIDFDVLLAPNARYTLESNLSLRLASGSGIDDFDIRIKVELTCTNTIYYTRIVNFRPPTDVFEHDKWKVVNYFDTFKGTDFECDTGGIKVTSQIRNTGNDIWEADNRLLIFLKYD